MDVEQYIESLKRAQADTALQGALKPRGRDTFEYGLLCGLTQGYEHALQILKEAQDSADGKPRPAKPVRPVNPYLSDLDDAPTLPEQYGRRR
jgi:hypothetical protein